MTGDIEVPKPQTDVPEVRQNPGFLDRLRWRLVFACLGAIGMAIIYGLKVNLSVVIVAMLNHTDLEEAASLHEAQENALFDRSIDDSSGIMCFNTTKPVRGRPKPTDEDGPFSWPELEQGLVLGSYFWGYMATQIPGGRFAELFGGKWLFFGAVVLNIVATLLSPICSYAGYQYLIAMRILEGLGGGVTFPAMNVLISKWAPKEERSAISSICYGGTALGTVISIPTSGLIAGTLGWEAVFYLHGGLACFWCVLWVVFVTDTPEQNRFISHEEKDLISNSLQSRKGKKAHAVSKAIPWKSILTSTPVWTIIVCHTLNNFGWYMLLVELPTFMHNGLGFNIKENAALSCLPFLCSWLFSIVYSNRLDWARGKNYLSTTTARKLSMGIASVIPAACLIGVCLSGCDRYAVVILMVIATLFLGAMFSGVFSNHCDIASNYAGVLMGMSNMAATVPGFAVPAFVGILTHGQHGLGPWHTVFYTTAALMAVEAVIYTLFASGVEQKWNHPKSSKNADNDAELESSLVFSH